MKREGIREKLHELKEWALHPWEKKGEEEREKRAAGSAEPHGMHLEEEEHHVDKIAGSE